MLRRFISPKKYIIGVVSSECFTTPQVLLRATMASYPSSSCYNDGLDCEPLRVTNSISSYNSAILEVLEDIDFDAELAKYSQDRSPVTPQVTPYEEQSPQCNVPQEPACSGYVPNVFTINAPSSNEGLLLNDSSLLGSGSVSGDSLCGDLMNSGLTAGQILPQLVAAATSCNGNCGGTHEPCMIDDIELQTIEIETPEVSEIIHSRGRKRADVDHGSKKSQRARKRRNAKGPPKPRKPRSPRKTGPNLEVIAKKASGTMEKPVCKLDGKCYCTTPEHMRCFSHNTPKVYLRTPAFPAIVFKPNVPPYSATAALEEMVNHPCVNFLESCYELRFAEDFFDVYGLCCQLNPENPRVALVPLLDISLVGPFDVLALKDKLRLTPSSKLMYNLHYRYFHDAPEFQTIMVDTRNETHWGYYRDDPRELPVFIGACAPSKFANPWQVKIIGANLIMALRLIIKEKLKQAQDEDVRNQLKCLEADILGLGKQHHLSYKSKRKCKSLGNVFHRVRIVVPFDDHSRIGYRPLTLSNVELKLVFKNVKQADTPERLDAAMEPLRRLHDAVKLANEEFDYGMALEFGLDLYLYGCERLDPLAQEVLTNVYTLLGRNKFAEIAKQHLKHRQSNKLLWIPQVLPPDYFRDHNKASL